MAALSPQQLEAFETRGFVRLQGAFGAAEARAMEQRVWAELGARGVHPERRDTWVPGVVSHLQEIKADPVFEPIGGAPLRGALDQLLGAERWRTPRQWGQFLVAFPDPQGTWDVPAGMWHTDFDYTEPLERPFGALVFSFLCDLPPRTGGTAVVTGSHRLVRRLVEGRSREELTPMKRGRKALFAADPWLQRLQQGGGSEDRIARFMDREQVIEGVRVRVDELTGAAGDVVVAHPWLLHTPAPNCGRTPRFSRVQRIRLVDAERGAGERPGVR